MTTDITSILCARIRRRMRIQIKNLVNDGNLFKDQGLRRKATRDFTARIRLTYLMSPWCVMMA